jgi:TolA-binding protein
LLMVGRSYEDESVKLASASREKAFALANEEAQRNAYQMSQAGRREQEEFRSKRIAGLKAGGKGDQADIEEAYQAANIGQFNTANVKLFAQKASQDVEALTAMQLADRQDKINAALRKAVEAYTTAAKVPGADKAGDALLRVATIQDQQLKDAKAAMETWLEIVRQFSGTSVAEDASWRIAQYYERQSNYAEAIEAYKAFLRNYRSSPKAGQAQFAIAESYEHLGQWVNAMDSYTNYINNFPSGPLVAKAREQINWIKTYRL